MTLRLLAGLVVWLREDKQSLIWDILSLSYIWDIRLGSQGGSWKQIGAQIEVTCSRDLKQ